jgi:hypothetical protein
LPTSCGGGQRYRIVVRVNGEPVLSRVVAVTPALPGAPVDESRGWLERARALAALQAPLASAVALAGGAPPEEPLDDGASGAGGALAPAPAPADDDQR